MQSSTAFFNRDRLLIASIRPSECACNQGDYKEHQKYVEDDFRDRRRSRGYPRKSKDSCDKRYHQKC